MAKVILQNVEVLNNPSLFGNPFKFCITFEGLENLDEDTEWKIIYVGSAESEEHDQILDDVLVGPVREGRHRFLLESSAPDPKKIPVCDAIGATVVLITATYREQEFVRVGYYLNNEYIDPELKENMPAVPNYDKIQRNILADKPRVTRFRINWGDGMEEEDGENVPPETPHDPNTTPAGPCTSTQDCPPPTSAAGAGVATAAVSGGAPPPTVQKTLEGNSNSLATPPVNENSMGVMDTS